MKRKKFAVLNLTVLLAAGLLSLSLPLTSFAQQSGKADMETAPQVGMTSDRRVELIREYYQTIEAQPFDESRVSPFFAENYINHPPRKAPPGMSVKVATLNLLRNLSRGFPDAKRTLIMVEPVGNDRVMAYFSFSGTHTGEFFSHAPTGNKVSFVGVDVFKIKDGKFVENHHVEDLTTLLEQLKPKAQ